MSNVKIGILLAATVSVLAGCSSTTINSAERADPVAQKQMVGDKRVTTDASLNRKVQIVGVNESTGAAGFMKVQVELQNMTRKQHSFTYRMEWFDENGIVITSASSSSRPKTIEGKESIFITATAPTDRAKDFRIKLLEAK